MLPVHENIVKDMSMSEQRILMSWVVNYVGEVLANNIHEFVASQWVYSWEAYLSL